MEEGFVLRLITSTVLLKIPLKRKSFLLKILYLVNVQRYWEFQKVYVKGECVNFSPDIINRFLGIDKEGVTELEATGNQVSREITAITPRFPQQHNLNIKSE